MLTCFKYNESTTCTIEKLNNRELELLSTGVSAGTIHYDLKGVPSIVDLLEFCYVDFELLQSCLLHII